MELICPRCNSKSNELIECDSCGTIGCIRCMKKSYGKWVCFKCEAPEEERRDYLELEEKDQEEVSDAFSAMFG